MWGGRPHGVRTNTRTTHRNGYRNRVWSTRVGDIELHIPKLTGRVALPLLETMLQRGLRGVRRVVSIFPDADSLNRLTGAILIEENEEWMEARRYISESPMAKLAAPPALPPPGGAAPHSSR